MNKKNLKYFISVCLMLTFTVVFATKNPPQPKESDGPPDPPGLPINGGAIYLLISGVALGVYTLKKKK